MRTESGILEDFHLLADYLWNTGKLEDLNEYKENLSAFLSHVIHIKAYDFVASFCENKKILDVGCFIGYGEVRIHSHAKEIIAIDADDKALEFARKSRLFPNVKFEKVDARRLPFSNETFDIVIAFQLIEHIPPNEVSKFICEAVRILKEKGFLFILTPNRKFRLLPFQRPFNQEHYQEFTAKRLLKVLKTNFENIVIKGTRAKKWIEEIERTRVRKSPFRVYIRDPFYRFSNIILPARIKKRLKETKSKRIKSSGSKNRRTADNNDQMFSNLVRKISMNDFYLEDQASNKSIDLFAICRKTTQSK